MNERKEMCRQKGEREGEKEKKKKYTKQIRQATCEFNSFS